SDHLDRLGPRPGLRLVGVNADRVDGPVHADAAGQLGDGGDRVLLVEVDDLGPLGAGHVQPVGQRVDGQHPAGVHQFGAGDGELADRAAAEDGHDVARLDLGEVGPEVAGGEDVGE